MRSTMFIILTLIELPIYMGNTIGQYQSQRLRVTLGFQKAILYFQMPKESAKRNAANTIWASIF